METQDRREQRTQTSRGTEDREQDAAPPSLGDVQGLTGMPSCFANTRVYLDSVLLEGRSQDKARLQSKRPQLASYNGQQVSENQRTGSRAEEAEKQECLTQQSPSVSLSVYPAVGGRPRPEQAPALLCPAAAKGQRLMDE